MVTLNSGTPGSGKSLHTARDIRRYLLNGKTVIANFPINTDVVSKKGKRKIGEFIYLTNDKLTVEFLKDYAFKNHKVGKEGQSIIVIDEAGIMFNSRDWNAFDRKSWINFFMTHRHYGYNVLLVAQTDRLIDKQIRAFIEYDVKHRKANNYKTIGLILSIFRIQTFAAVTYWYGMRGADARCSAQLFRFRKRDAKLYDTMMLFSSENFGESIGEIKQKEVEDVAPDVARIVTDTLNEQNKESNQASVSEDWEALEPDLSDYSLDFAINEYLMSEI